MTNHSCSDPVSKEILYLPSEVPGRTWMWGDTLAWGTQLQAHHPLSHGGLEGGPRPPHSHSRLSSSISEEPTGPASTSDP